MKNFFIAINNIQAIKNFNEGWASFAKEGGLGAPVSAVNITIINTEAFIAQEHCQVTMGELVNLSHIFHGNALNIL